MNKQLELPLVTPAAQVAAIPAATIYRDSPESEPQELSADHVGMLRIPTWCRDTDVDLIAYKVAYTMGLSDAEQLFNNGKVAVWAALGAAASNARYQVNYYKPNVVAVAKLKELGVNMPELVGRIMIVTAGSNNSPE